MPAAVARAPAVTSARPWPALRTRPKTLSERTGSTQGMTFKTSPPRSPRASIQKMPSPAAGRPADRFTAPAAPLPATPAMPPALPPIPPMPPNPGTGWPPAPTRSSSLASVVTGGRHCLSLQDW